MRKIKYFVFFLICLCCFSLTTKAASCDANSDGKVTQEDSNLIENIVAGLTPMPTTGSTEFSAADCDGDGRITLKDATYISTSKSKVSCGNVTDIPIKIPELTSYCITLIQIAVPIILIIMGSLDLFKGVTAQKEDEIKKGQQMFIKRLITAAIIFFVIVITKFLISVVADATSSANITECIDCFLSGVDNCRR